MERDNVQHQLLESLHAGSVQQLICVDRTYFFFFFFLIPAELSCGPLAKENWCPTHASLHHQWIDTLGTSEKSPGLVRSEVI